MKEVSKLFLCEESPCPMITQCWISRPMEKTIFLRFMYLMTSFSIALTLVEIAQLGARRVRRQITKEPRFY